MYLHVTNSATHFSMLDEASASLSAQVGIWQRVKMLLGMLTSNLAAPAFKPQFDFQLQLSANWTLGSTEDDSSAWVLATNFGDKFSSSHLASAGPVTIATSLSGVNQPIQDFSLYLPFK